MAPAIGVCPMTEKPNSHPEPSRRPISDHPLGAVARFLGHSAAAALAFAGLTLISLVPVVVLRGLHELGFGDLVSSLHPLETVLQLVDVVLFLAVFLTGAVLFVAEIVADAERRIIELLKRRHR